MVSPIIYLTMIFVICMYTAICAISRISIKWSGWFLCPMSMVYRPIWLLYYLRVGCGFNAVVLGSNTMIVHNAEILYVAWLMIFEWFAIQREHMSD